MPDGVYPYIYESGEESSDNFYTVHETDLTNAEIAEYLTYRKLSLMNTIKNCVVFFVVVSFIGMIVSLVAFLSAM